MDTGLGSFVGGGLANLAGNLFGRLPCLRDGTLRQILIEVVEWSKLAINHLASLFWELTTHTNILSGLARQQDTQVQHLVTQNQLLRDQNLLLQKQNQHLEELSGSTRRLVLLMEEQINGR